MKCSATLDNNSDEWHRFVFTERANAWILSLAQRCLHIGMWKNIVKQYILTSSIPLYQDDYDASQAGCHRDSARTERRYRWAIWMDGYMSLLWKSDNDAEESDRGRHLFCLDWFLSLVIAPALWFFSSAFIYQFCRRFSFMSTARCCLSPHPSRLLERLETSIYTVKFIRTTASILQTRLTDEYEHLESISCNLHRYFMHYGPVSSGVFDSFSELLTEINGRMTKLTDLQYEVECLTRKCSIWLKNLSNNSALKLIRTELKRYGKQFVTFQRRVKTHADSSSLTKTFWNDFSSFQTSMTTSYAYQCSQMDLIERDFLALFIQSIPLFVSIVSTDQRCQTSKINTDDEMHRWREKNTFHIPWLPEDHEQKQDDVSVESSPSNIDIQIIESSSNMSPTETREIYPYAPNWDWLFPSSKPDEDLSSVGVDRTVMSSFIPILS